MSSVLTEYLIKYKNNFSLQVIVHHYNHLNKQDVKNVRIVDRFKTNEFFTSLIK